MEYKFSQEFIQTLLRDYSRAIVGRLCKQVELLTAKSDLSEKQKLDLLKSFNRELIYEHFRDLENQLIPWEVLCGKCSDICRTPQFPNSRAE